MGVYNLNSMKIVGLLLLCFLMFATGAKPGTEDISFTDDFEHGLQKWEFVSKTTMEPLSDKARLVDSQDSKHGTVLSLEPGQLIALIKGTEDWSSYKLEGDVYFPKTAASLMGLVYNFNLVPRPNWNEEGNKLRTEFGSVYIKCGGSYIRANPHYDGAAGRTLYEDYKTPLTGKAAIKIKEWKHFKYEVVGDDCHLYVDDMERPKVTFHGYRYNSGRVGFRPRSSGTECWVDNVQIRTIDRPSFKGEVVPEGVTWEPGRLITDWDAIGPFSKPVGAIEEAEDAMDRAYTVDGEQYRWASFSTDHRGCVVSGKICDFNPPARRLAYFRTSIRADEAAKTALRFSSRSDLTVFVSGKAAGKVGKVRHIWPDFWKVERHPPMDVEVSLERGVNHITVLVDGGQYPGCGFFAYVEEVGIKEMVDSEDFTFVQLCDPQFGGATTGDAFGGSEPDAVRIRRYVQAIRQINELKPDFAVICGDHVARSNENTFRQFRKISKQFSVPYYLAPGNHDFNPERGDEKVTPERLELYRQYLGKDYFSIEHKGYTFVFVGTPLWLTVQERYREGQFSGKIRQEYENHDEWVRQTLLLAKRKNTPVFIVGHHPLNPAQKKPLAPGHLSDEKRQELFSLFKQCGVVGVLGGHGHQVVIKEYQGIPFVHSEVTSFIIGRRNEVQKDKPGWGFRLWHIKGRPPFKHEFIPLIMGGGIKSNMTGTTDGGTLH